MRIAIWTGRDCRQNIQENIQANQAPKDTLTDVPQNLSPRTASKSLVTIRQNIQENIQANQAPKDTLTDVQQKLVPQECLLTARKKENKTKMASRPFCSQVQAHLAHPIATDDRHENCNVDWTGVSPER